MSKTVYQLIAAVSAEIAAEGISKNRKNQQQGYAFRGIDDVYNALAPMLSKHGLVILPRCLSREITERTSAKGGSLFDVVVEAEFDFISSHDGSKHTVKTYGEAMDSADKATNKAMSAAYKYAAFQSFCIPTEGDNDADATTHVLAETKREYQRISKDQMIVIADLIKETGLKLESFYKKFNVESIAALPVEEYEQAIKSINDYRAAREAKNAATV